MEAELVALATSGATTMVNLMATNLWTTAQGRFAALFGHRAEAVAEELEEVREAGGEAEDLIAEWRPRLQRLLAADPAAAAALRALVEEYAPPAEAHGGGVQNTISGGEFHQAVIQTGHIGSVKL
ncbi:hypothetical protein CFP65_1173 [Kitasatospora sp. MMS16-BH015]|uniref:hypothetical protein n=1 Tax=Kitasatospora sp. MMS16-BH015 TaxID=2018025 RepID=UPI000CA25736|nr:hypothetical protein [Kitasatospora sp. MMS16-BH015]AUG76083.1 hypothetical protein CFP65_1173 [Kitasatospora sp. MMS16-BH015]